MSDYLENLSQIPSWIAIPDVETSVKSWLTDLNDRVGALEGISDDSFSEADFYFARNQAWGIGLDRFSDFATFRRRVNAFIKQEVLKDNDFIASCEERGGTIVFDRDREGIPMTTCIEPTKPRPVVKKPKAKRPRPPRAAPSKGGGIDLGHLSLASVWWSQQGPASAKESRGNPEVIASLHRGSFQSDNSLSDELGKLLEIGGPGNHFRDLIIGTALDQAGDRGLDGETVDIVFAVDTSGSMTPMALLVADNVKGLLASLEKKGAKKVRIGLVGFGHVGNVRVLMPLTEMNPRTRDGLLRRLATINLNGGIEPVTAAAKEALRLLPGEPTLQQVLVITDRDGLADDPDDFSQAVKMGRSMGAAVKRLVL